jgi:Protein of unknown function (DUF3040)
LGGTVPLSEHEQRQLDEIEQALYAEHPRFARAVRAADPQVHYKRRVICAALVFVVGLALLPYGVSSQIWGITVVGFVVMLTACYWAASSYRRMTGITTGRGAVSLKEAKPNRKARLAGQEPSRRGEKRGEKRGERRGEKRGGKRSGGGIGERLEERWRRRQEDSGN